MTFFSANLVLEQALLMPLWLNGRFDKYNKPV
jgi:hypothetical protein